MKTMRSIAKLTALIVAVVAAIVIAGTAEPADAASRSPEGAVKMPSNRTLSIKLGKNVKINFGYDYNTTSYYYFKIKPKKKGVITFKNDYTHGSSVALMNSKKKLVSRDGKYDCFLSAGSQYGYQRYVCFGVQKGKTYYVRVKGASTEREEYGKPYVGTVICTNTKVSGLKYGKSKKKSVKLKRKKTRNGVIVAGVKGAQWYKIKSVKKSTKIIFKSKKNCGTLYATVYYKSYGRWYNSRMFAMRSTDAWKNGRIIKSNKKGNTYYIKVYGSGKTTGQYSLWWK